MTKEQMMKRLEANLKVARQDQRSPIRSVARYAMTVERRAIEAANLLKNGATPEQAWAHFQG